MNTKIEVSMFNGKGDFKSWSRRMKVLLSHNKVHYALRDDLKDWPVEAKKNVEEIKEEAYNLLVLNLSDNVLRKKIHTNSYQLYP